MRRVTSATLGSLLLAGGLVLGGCHPVRGHPHFALFTHPTYTKVVSKLTCPDREGELTRTDVAADGRSCRYTGAHDEDVALTLLDLNGAAPSAALHPIEASLQSALPTGEGTDKVAASKSNAEDDSDHDGDDAENHGHDHTHIDLPGVHIEADDDKAHVRLPGVSIDSDGDKANVHTSIGGFAGTSIEANGDGAVIRAGSSDSTGADLTFILASDKAGPDGVHAAGYIARGPAVGPLVVATFKSKRSEHGEGQSHDDISRLVNLNVGR